MGKKKYVKNTNKVVEYNYFDLGGTIGNIGGAAASIAEASMANDKIADTSRLESTIQGAKSKQVEASTLDDLMNEWGAYSPLESVSFKDVRGGSTGQRLLNTLKATTAGASAGADTGKGMGTMGGAIGGIIGGVVGLGSGIAGWLTGDSKARKKTKALNAQIAEANMLKEASLLNRADTIDTQTDLNILSNLMADGGNIYIKPSKRGTFTAAAKRHSMGVQEFANKVLSNKEDYSTAMVKKANFAKNASKWKHAFGGTLSTNGADWDSGVVIIGNGDTHERNPMEGVQMGIDPNGIPNLVEEGEVIWNNYVFSNRLKVPKNIKSSYKLNINKDTTFAEAAKKIQKESEERPNDPISKRGLEDAMINLSIEQEMVRQKKQASQEGKKYAYGGKKGKLYSGTGPYTNFLGDVDGGGNAIGYTKNGILMDDGSIATYGSPEYKAASEYGLPEKAATRSVTEVAGDTGSNLSWLRYAPVIGNAIGAAQNLLSRPDYSRADKIQKEAESLTNYSPIEINPIGNYLQYNPFDTNFYLNKLNAEAGATRRAIMNTSSPSKNAALLAADYNAQGRLGDLARQAEEYNLSQRQAVEQFNRATNQANAELGLKAAIANNEMALKSGAQRLSGVANAMAMKEAIDANRSKSLDTNLSNLFTSLGSIGKEKVFKNMIKNNPWLLYDWMGNYKRD